MSALISQGILHFRFQFRFQFHPHFVRRNFFHDIVVENPQLFVKSVIDQCKLGFSKPDLPVSLFNQLISLRRRPSIISFNQLFTAMSKIQPNPPFSTIVNLSNQLELSGLRPDSYSVGILANCYCSLGRVDFAFSLLGKLIKLGYLPDIVFFTTLIDGLIASDNLYVAVQLLDKIVKLGIQPTVVTYRAILKGFDRYGDYSGAHKFLRDMEHTAPFTPDVFIYNSLIGGFCKNSRLAEALDLFEEMKSKGVLPNVVTYNTLIKGMCSVGRCNDTKGILAEMLDNNIAPNVQTYTTLIDIRCKEGNVNEAMAILGLMSKRGVHADAITYGALVNWYRLLGEMDMAENVVDVMVKDGIAPDIVIFSNLLNGYCESKQANKAVVMFENMRLRGTRIIPNVSTYNTIINALCKANRVHCAILYFEKMKGRGLAPNVFTYGCLLDGLLKNAWIDTAMSLRGEMARDGVAPNIYLYNKIINNIYEVGRLVEAAEMFYYLVAKGLQLKVSTYNIMIKVLCRQGLLVDAIALLKKMADDGFPLNARTYNTIILEFLNANDVAKALDHIDIMRRQRFEAHANTAILFTGLLTDSSISGDTDKTLLQKYFLENRGVSEEMENVHYDDQRAMCAGVSEAVILKEMANNGCSPNEMYLRLRISQCE